MSGPDQAEPEEFQCAVYEVIPRLAREGSPIKRLEPATVMDRWQRGIDRPFCLV